ncbi:MAG: hypothetical protein H2069_08535 [Legionella sp.]|nr:hypothetical protein [Legionella sp.]
MPLPLKALRYEQLKLDGNPVPPSGHPVSKCQFVDVDNQIKVGFFKPLDSTYPPLLAKYTVAVSVAIRSALGARAAEDRLVFNEHNELCGTLSINLPEYKPLLTLWKQPPLDKDEAELVHPSQATLLKHNVAELLVSAWRYKCDDRHPGNVSVCGLIDWDMCLYPYTYIIKGGRYIDTVLHKLPEHDMELSSEDLDNFPNIKNRTHWPTNDIPQNMYVLKGFADPTQFQALAENNALATGNGNVPFQEQMFSAILKELLTYDSKQLHQRLNEYIGNDLPLNYRMLELEKSDRLEKTYPTLFNEKTNKQPFLKHAINVFAQEHEKFYKLVTEYAGCDRNIKGVSVISFYRFLRNKPSTFTKIRSWLKATGEPFDEERLLQRYHQIWRDSHRCMLTDGVIKIVKKLAADLSKELRVSDSLYQTSSFLSHSLNVNEDINTLHCDEKNKLRLGYQALLDMIKKLENLSEKYFLAIPAEMLHLSDNQKFCDDVLALYQESKKNILRHLASTSWGTRYEAWLKRFEQFYLGFDFERHLVSKDTPLKAQVELDYSTILRISHTNKDIVEPCLQTLFEWAKKTHPHTLEALIHKTIDKDYKPNPLSSKRHRGDFILSYLNRSKNEDGANRIATIFSMGGTEKTSLNTRLMKVLINQMLADKQLPIQSELLSVKQAVDSHQFDAAYYASQAQTLALQDKSFTHRYSITKISLLQETLFKAVDTCSADTLKIVVANALQEYAPKYNNRSFSLWKCIPTLSWTHGRANPIEKLLKATVTPNSKLVARILSEGGNEPKSYNTIFLRHLLHYFHQTKPNLSILSFAFQLPIEDLAYYGTRLKDYAVKYTEKIPANFPVHPTLDILHAPSY